MGLTEDSSDPGLDKIVPEGIRKGQQEKYLVLSEAERAAGFVRPVRTSYQHVVCGRSTVMAQAIAETYARDPKFYGGTFCAYCGNHYALRVAGSSQFLWDDSSGQAVGD